MTRKPTTATPKRAGNRTTPWTPDEAREILADLRTLSMTCDRELARRAADRIGPVMGRLFWEPCTLDEYWKGEARNRLLDDREQRVAAILRESQDLCEGIWFGWSSAANAHERLSRLVDALERELQAGKAGIREPGSETPIVSGETWSRVMSRADIAERMLKSSAKWRTLEKVYGSRLKQIGGKGSRNWQLRLDGLPENLVKEINRL